MNCTHATLEFYKYTVGKFLEWIEQRGVTSPEQVIARYVREYIAELAAKGKADTTVWNNARAIKTMLLFWQAEGYIPAVPKYEMPKKAKKRLPMLTTEQLQHVLSVCNLRDKTIVLFMVDSGLRREEVCKLDWEDVNMQNGLVRIRMDKGRKDRSAVIGARTRRHC